MSINTAGGKAPECVGDIAILIIDYDTASVPSLMSMLGQFSNKVMSVDLVSTAISMIEEQQDIGLIIANIEMPHIDSHSFFTALLHKKVPLILINPEKKTKKTSDHLYKQACFFLNKPVSENDIKNMWQHVFHGEEENVMEPNTKKIHAFRESLKRHRTGQASLLEKRPFIETFRTSEIYQKRRSLENVDWKTELGCPVKIGNKREGKKPENIVGRRFKLWTDERHIKFLAAISILGEKDLRPISIWRIINDPNLSYRQVASHYQSFKAQVKQMNDAFPRNECKSKDKTLVYPSDYEYPFDLSYFKKNLIACNSVWYNLKKKMSSSSSTPQYFFKKAPVERKTKMPKLRLDEKLDLSILSEFVNTFNKSSMEVNCFPSATSSNPPYNIPSSNNGNHIGLDSTGFNPSIISSLPSSVGPSNANALQMESARICLPQSKPNLCQPPNSVLESNRNQISLDLSPSPDSFVPLPDLWTMEETSIDQMDWIPSTENYSHHEFNMNSMDWIPSPENYVLPETDRNINPGTSTNQMNWVSSGEVYVPFDSMISSEIDINHMGTNMTNVGLVSSERNYGIPPETNMPILETNTNQLPRFFPAESNVLPGNISSFETNTTQMDLVPWEARYDALDNMVPLATNMEEMNYVSCEESYDGPVEDLISFDIGVNAVDMPSWLENCSPSDINNVSHELAFNDLMDSTPHNTMEGHDHSLAMNVGSTSQQHNMMESCEYQNVEAANQREDMEKEDDFDDQRENMAWIEELMNNDG